jgi:hypothetical protein
MRSILSAVVLIWIVLATMGLALDLLLGAP